MRGPWRVHFVNELFRGYANEMQGSLMELMDERVARRSGGVFDRLL